MLPKNINFKCMVLYVNQRMVVIILMIAGYFICASCIDNIVCFITVLSLLKKTDTVEQSFAHNDSYSNQVFYILNQTMMPHLVSSATHYSPFKKMVLFNSS